MFNTQRSDGRKEEEDSAQHGFNRRFTEGFSRGYPIFHPFFPGRGEVPARGSITLLTPLTDLIRGEPLTQVFLFL